MTPRCCLPRPNVLACGLPLMLVAVMNWNCASSLQDRHPDLVQAVDLDRRSVTVDGDKWNALSTDVHVAILKEAMAYFRQKLGGPRRGWATVRDAQGDQLSINGFRGPGIVDCRSYADSADSAADDSFVAAEDSFVAMEELPVLISIQPPVYPEVAGTRIDEVVFVRASVGTSGEVLEAHAESGPEMLFIAAENCMKTAIFKPATQNHKPVIVSIVMPITFSLE